MSTHNKLRRFKATMVGDGCVGKTCISISYTQNLFSEEFIPTVFDNFAKNIQVDGVDYVIEIWDTSGLEDFDRLRPLAYPQTDCFIVCYAVNNPASLSNVEYKWLPELKYHCPEAAIILVGTKTDLVDSTSNVDAELEGEKMTSKIKAKSFVLCSAKTGEGVKEVFIGAVRAVYPPPKLCSLQ